MSLPIYHHRTLVNRNAPYMCPAECGRSFATAHAVNTHLGSAKKCLWYRKGKLQSLAIPQPQEDNGEEASGLDMLIDDEHMEETIGEVIQELQEDLFSFIPIAHSNIIDDGENTAGPSLHQNSIVLDDNEDERIEVEHPTAGKVISMDKTLHQRWRREFIAAGGDGKDVEMGEASDPKFFLFASEMDWRVACWAIQDGIGHQSFNWLLSIPGVREKLGLSYHNIHGLHKIVDYSIPSRAEWKSTMISFPDTPNDTYLVQYRNVLSAIRTLLGNPAHAKHIVYCPKKIFTNARKESRIYHEMWTGKWWHAIQARLPSGQPWLLLLLQWTKPSSHNSLILNQPTLSISHLATYPELYVVSQANMLAYL
ncbi:hypothetical protein SERLADRAFT_443811 [Serpula lacrymans var. lacrymans S7.9]|uniref:C2H2-type domain-containing protein n=1 Tax=Serpula lacrymans var. lacrymans (strain S7.9) TaxID=578457 RepID=F8PDM1_SERL9|nr:uncharacterized protein SERLADRAFT_443811 [Serpula lacrymans var. lacrymans S7.9]EGO18842.1 hypothetical protein SERLADRAFT_443811 [Serpula lacrymans var. lacrymans S7.9]